MEEALTDCLVRVKNDLSNLSKVRDYLDKKGEEEAVCTVTWRTIEAFNSILSACSSQSTPQTNALDTLLDSFYYLARNNTNPDVWNDFGFELGIICVKVLAAIERSEIFEVLFCKLLTVVNVICEHNTSVWKSSARQILNVFINKKFSLTYFETVLKLYICILRNIESCALSNFSSQNFHLLKTLSMLVQGVGDFEIQSDIVELVFLHLSNKTESMSDFFSASEKKLFGSLQFADFEKDCRIYLNAINKPRGGLERKVYSVCCRVLYLGGHYVEPPLGANVLWVDANKETERLSLRCADFESESNRVIYILFADVLRASLAEEKSGGCRCLTIQTKSLRELQFDAKNNDICLMIDNGADLLEFVNFLNGEIKRKNKFDRKLSKTKCSLFIDRNKMQEVQDSAITSSEKRGGDHSLPDVLNLLDRADRNAGDEAQFKSSQNSKYSNPKIKTPPLSQEQSVAVPNLQLSPNSFVESLNQHIGKESPEMRHTFENSIETIEFPARSNPKTQHKLFRGPDEELDEIKTEEPNNFSLIFDENKENKPTTETAKPKLRTYERKREQTKPKALENISNERGLRDRNSLEVKLVNTQSQDYFRQNLFKKKKPSLPKFKWNTRNTDQETEKRGSKKEKRTKRRPSVDAELTKISVENKQKKVREVNRDGENKENQKKAEELKKQKPFEFKSKWEFSEDNKSPRQSQRAQPSLLDPNGYAYRRWCTPTTSERSNFWLKKLRAIQKPKLTDDNVFDFSEDSDSVSANAKRKKRRVIHSKRKCRTKEARQTSLREVKEILRKTSPKGQRRSPPIRRNTSRSEDLPKSPEQSANACYNEPQQSDIASKRNSTPESVQKDNSDKSNSDLNLSSEEEEENVPVVMKKRERSDEDTSQSKTHKKKKSKGIFPSGKLLTNLRRRLEKREQEDRQRTNEIVQTVSTAVSHLFNHLQRKEARRAVSYLRAVGEAAAAVGSEVEGLSLRAKRVQRATVYFQAGCSVSDIFDSLEDHFFGVRSALKDFAEKKDVSKTISTTNERLKSLIKSGIEKLIDGEMATRRRKLLRCVSAFGGDVEDSP